MICKPHRGRFGNSWSEERNSWAWICQRLVLIHTTHVHTSCHTIYCLLVQDVVFPGYPTHAYSSVSTHLYGVCHSKSTRHSSHLDAMLDSHHCKGHKWVVWCCQSWWCRVSTRLMMCDSYLCKSDNLTMGNIEIATNQTYAGGRHDTKCVPSGESSSSSTMHMAPVLSSKGHTTLATSLHQELAFWAGSWGWISRHVQAGMHCCHSLQ